MESRVPSLVIDFVQGLLPIYGVRLLSFLVSDHSRFPIAASCKFVALHVQ